MSLPDSTPLGEARDWLRERVEHGEVCPLCKQNAQVYRWTLYSTAAKALILFHRLGAANDFVHSSRLKEYGHTGQGDASRLRTYGLAEQMPGEAPDGNPRNGLWRFTQLGHDFVHERATVQKYVYVYDGRVMRRDGPPITIREALRDRFSYDELMGTIRS